MLGKGYLSVPEHTDIKSFAEELSLPVFAYKEGIFYRVVYDQESGMYMPDDAEAVSPETFTQLPNVDLETCAKIVKDAYAKRENLFKVSLSQSEKLV